MPIQSGNGNDLTATAFAASVARGMQTQGGPGNATVAKAGTLKSISRRNTASANAASTASVCPVNGQNRVPNAVAHCRKQSSGRRRGKRGMPSDVFVEVAPPKCAATGRAASVRNSARPKTSALGKRSVPINKMGRNVATTACRQHWLVLSRTASVPNSRAYDNASPKSSRPPI